MDETIRYTKVRTISEVLNVTFNYLRFNIKSISTGLLYYVLPFFVLSTIASSYLNKTAISLGNFIAFASTLFQNDFIESATIILLYFLALTLQNQIINKHLILNETLSSETHVQISQIKPTIADDLKQHFPNAFFLSISIILITFVLGIIFGAVLNTGITFNFAEDPLSFLIEIVPFLILILIVLPLTCYLIMASLFFAQRDKTGIYEALKKVWFYTRDKFLLTWAVAVIGLMIAYIINLILKIPFLALGFLGINTPEFVYFVLSGIITFFSLFASSAFQIICIFHLTSLEETKEGTIIKRKIESI